MEGAAAGVRWLCSKVLDMGHSQALDKGQDGLPDQNGRAAPIANPPMALLQASRSEGWRPRHLSVPSFSKQFLFPLYQPADSRPVTTNRAYAMSDVNDPALANPGRRDVMALGAGVATLMMVGALPFFSAASPGSPSPTIGDDVMSSVTTKDGVEIFYKDWGPRSGQPIVFHHGWPLSSDEWDTQMLFFVSHGYRVIAHDRRGHGRSSQVNEGHDMDHYADDTLAVVEHLDLRNAVHVGHSTGGGEALHSRGMARNRGASPSWY